LRSAFYTWLVQVQFRSSLQDVIVALLQLAFMYHVSKIVTNATLISNMNFSTLQN